MKKEFKHLFRLSENEKKNEFTFRIQELKRLADPKVGLQTMKPETLFPAEEIFSERPELRYH